MSYSGITAPIPLGAEGLRTDDAQSTLPPNVLIEAFNINLFANQIEKAAGSLKLNATALSDKIVALHDWHPNSSAQRLIAITADGKAYRDTGDLTFTSQTAINTGYGVLNNSSHFAEGGLETAGRDKKLFLFTGGNRQMKVLSADGTSFSDISAPAADWSSNYPTFGMQHRSRMLAFGNANDPHRIYLSETGDHEDFAGGGALTFSIFPGEGDRLSGAFNFNGRLFLLKAPFGVYYLDDSQPSSANWAIRKISSSYGTASNHSIVVALRDVLAGNATGSITSVAATEKFGDIESGDILSILRIEDYMRQITSSSAVSSMSSVYYQEKKQAFFSYQSTSGINQDRLLIVDLGKQTPRAYLYDKDQPSCLALRKDDDNIARPIYGNDEGYVYQMDNRATRDVGGSGYTGVFQTPHIDFSYVDPSLSSKNKIFQFLEIVFEPTGSWDVDVEVYIDDELVETIQFAQATGPTLGDFVLDVDTLTGTSPQAIRKPLHGMGRRISFKIKNANVGENFKIQNLNVSFKVSSEQQVGFANS